MIPEIGIIVGVYAIARLVEILSASEGRFTSNTARGVTKALAACSILLIGFLTVDLVIGGLAGRSPVGTPQIDMPSLFNAPPARR